MTKTPQISIYQYYSGLIQLINQKELEKQKYKQKVIEDLKKQPNQTKTDGQYLYSIRTSYTKFIVNVNKLKQNYPNVYKDCTKSIIIKESVTRKRIK